MIAALVKNEETLAAWVHLFEQSHGQFQLVLHVGVGPVSLRILPKLKILVTYSAMAGAHKVADHQAFARAFLSEYLFSFFLPHPVTGIVGVKS